MILEFSVGNFRSFNQKRTISFEASTAIKDDPRGNYFKQDGYSVLRSLAVYGANSSGKSNLLRAIVWMAHIIRDSVKLNDGDELRYDPFLLSEKEDRPSHYEILFTMNGERYRYGFEYTTCKIEGEWLFIKKGKKKEDALFVRSEEGIGVNEELFSEGIGLEEKTNDNRLFLSLVAQLGGGVSKDILNWFRKKLVILSGVHSAFALDVSKPMYHKQTDSARQAMKLFDDLQLGFKSIFTTEKEVEDGFLPNDLPDAIKNELKQRVAGKKKIEIHSIHNKYDDTGAIIGETSFDVEKNESDGTNKLISLACIIFDVLSRGAALFIDELDTKMHPLISERIIRLFNDPETNPGNAQLIFTTHDTHLLSANLLRRDQIWFTEKDATEQTDLYAMTDIVLPNGQKPRNDSNYEKNYMAGRYGAIPFIK